MSDSERNEAGQVAGGRTAAPALQLSYLVVVLLLAPIFLFPSIGGWRLAGVLILPVLWTFRMLRGENPVPVTPLNGGIAVLLLMVLVSVQVTFDIGFSTGKVLGLVFGLVLFFAIIEVARAGIGLRIVLDGYVLAGTALAVLGLLGTNWIGKVAVVQDLTAQMPAVVRGIPGQETGFQPNAIAGALVLFVPVQTVLCLDAIRQGGVLRRVACLSAFSVTAVTLLLTQSRGGWVALAGGLAAWAAWHSGLGRRMMLAVATLAGLLGGFLWPRLERTFSHAIGAGFEGNIQGRLELWSRALDGIRDFGFTGMGMNAFRKVLPVLYPTFVTSPDFDVAHAHNQLLQVALDLGVPGLIAYLAIWLGAAGLLSVSIRGARTPHDKMVFGGLAAGLTAHFLFGMADAIALGAKVGIVFWMALALVVLAHDSAQQKGDDPA